MRHLSDNALHRLRDEAEEPDLSHTRYRLLGLIARGGMGVVYSAEDVPLQRRVALKVLESMQDELADRLMREARVLAKLEHPGIVPVHDVGTLPDGRVFYIMKFVEGQRLDEHIPSLPTLADKLRVFLRICEPVAFAHARGVVHRDLKPANVMAGPFGEVLVIDWGLAKILTDPSENISRAGDSKSAGEGSASTGHGRVMGTPGYMSPEQGRGEIGSLDARSDIFSLGELLRFVVGGEAAAPRALKAICRKACAQEKENRYASVQELSLDVSRYLDGLAVTAHRESLWEKLGRFYRRNRFFILLMAAYLITRVALIVFFRHHA